MKISVVMTTYNGADYLEEQILSILNQTIPPDEFIVCDDCSTDGTVAILEKYQKEQKLTYVVNDGQLGLINNFKKAVSLASAGNYVALSDQDDEWLPYKLERSAVLLEAIEDPALPCMVYTDLVLVDQSGVILNHSFRNELGQDKYVHQLQTLLYGNFVNGCTVLMNAELKCRFAEIPNDVKLNHDGWLALTAFTFGRAEGINIPLVRYRKHDHNVSISADTKPRNRYRSNLQEILTAFRGNDDFLSAQFETVSRFYACYKDQIAPDKTAFFDQFLKLDTRPYIFKKLAFRKLVKQFRV